MQMAKNNSQQARLIHVILSDFIGETLEAA